MSSGETLEKWRIGDDFFRYSPDSQIVMREILSANTDGTQAGVGSSESHSWSTMEELNWITKESFWFRYDNPSGSLLIFMEDEDAFQPEPVAQPPGAQAATPTTQNPPTSPAPGAPLAAATGTGAPPSEINPVASPDQPSVPVPEFSAAELATVPEVKLVGGKILTADPKFPWGLIPGVPLKSSVRAAAIDLNTRLPRVVQIGIDSFVYSYETAPSAPAVPAKITPLVRPAAPPVNPAVSSVPVP